MFTSRAWLSAPLAGAVVATFAALTPASAHAAPSPDGVSTPGTIPRTITAKLSGTKVTRGDKLYISGSVNGVRGPQRIHVGYELPGGRTYQLSSSKTQTNGHFKVRVSTAWVASTRIRVTAPATSTHTQVSLSKPVTVKRPGGTRGSAKAHTMLLAGASWDPCKTITYKINTTAAPAGAASDVRAALGRVTEASGLRFKAAGSTSYIPYAQTKYHKERPKTGLVIAWSSPKQVPALAGATIGRGGFEVAARAKDGRGRTALTIANGGAVLDSGASIKSRFGARGHQALLMHEIGHAVGLGHVNDKTQLMNPVLQTSDNTYGKGDIAGLVKVGMANGCHTR